MRRRTHDRNFGKEGGFAVLFGFAFFIFVMYDGPFGSRLQARAGRDDHSGSTASSVTRRITWRSGPYYRLRALGPTVSQLKLASLSTGTG